MDDYTVNLNMSGHSIFLKYIGEPPHGDSYHQMEINGHLFEGYVWGCMFLFPNNQRYIVCSWMKKPYERKTIIVDIESKSYHVFDEYWYDFKIDKEVLVLGNEQLKKTKTVVIKQIQDWCKYINN